MKLCLLTLIDDVSLTAIYSQVFIGGITALVCSSFGCYVGIKVALTEIRGELQMRKMETNHLDGATRDHEERIRDIERELSRLVSTSGG